MTRWLIQQNSQPEVHYYSQVMARALGAAHGWTQTIKDALQFNTEAEAEQYADRHLTMTQVQIVKSPFK